MNEENFKRVGFSAAEGGVDAADITSEGLWGILEDVIEDVPANKGENQGAKFDETGDKSIKTAWDVPDFGEYLGEIGDNEFLFYFVSGQDDGPVYESAKVSDIVIDGKNRCNAEIEYNLGEGCYAEPTKVCLSLIKSNGKWMMDDFSSEYMESAKEACLSYIKDQKKSYKTGEIELMIKEAAEEWLGWNDYELNSALDSLKADWDRFYKKYPKEK